MTETLTDYRFRCRSSGKYTRCWDYLIQKLGDAQIGFLVTHSHPSYTADFRKILQDTVSITSKLESY